MPWVKAKKYKYPPSQKRDKNFKAIPGVYDEPTYYNPKTKMYRYGTGKPKGDASRVDEYTEEEHKYILFDHLASCEIDLPTSWTLGKNDPESGCIDYKRYDIYGQKRKKPVSQKKADADFAAGEIKHYGKQVSSKKKEGWKQGMFSNEGFSIFNDGSGT